VLVATGKVEVVNVAVPVPSKGTLPNKLDPRRKFTVPEAGP
jgi:hypothetical protein